MQCTIMLDIAMAIMFCDIAGHVAIAISNVITQPASTIPLQPYS